jgi:hypothetical protein
VHRVAREHLRAAIASVLAQTWPGWELILLDDASGDPHVTETLEEAARRDPRIRTAARASNGGISVAANEVVAMARGSYVAFLDHDDVLHPRALELVARFLAWQPRTDYLFSDEDKLDQAGRHTEPCLKPGWSRQLLLATNYVSHLRVVRTDLLRTLGGYREGFEGAQDYDLALRAVAAGACFAHLPGVLYHWRAGARSMARAAAAKPAANARAATALLEHARGFLGGREPAVEELLPSASLFALSWEPLRPLTAEVVPGGLDPETFLRSLARARAPVVVVAPPDGLSVEALEALVARLDVPATAVVSARLLRHGRVRHSGWAATPDGRLLDPWRGAAASSPGYYNWMLAPGSRLAPPPWGWVGRREALIQGLAAAPDVPAAWRLWVGLARLGLDVVCAPIDLVAGSVRGDLTGSPPLQGLPWQWSPWVAGLGLG